MRRIIILIVLVFALAIPVDALEITAPTVPDSGMRFMPDTTEDFGQGLLEVLTDGMRFFVPALKEACGLSAALASAVIIASIILSISEGTARTVQMITAVAISVILLEPSGAMIALAADTIREISDYGKLLLPVMTTALAAQGGITASAALYAGTAVFDSILSNLVANLLVPMIYMYLALATVNGIVGDDLLKRLRDTMKGFMTWTLKTVLYIFTGYLGITGVVSGTTDAAVLKAAKLTISGAVPVVGGILSDASEAVLVSAGTLKNATGLYGLFAFLAIAAKPFLQIGAQYLVLKATAAVCGIFGRKEINELIGDFSTAMGFLLAMTGAVCVMFLISTVCFMKGVG